MKIALLIALVVSALSSAANAEESVNVCMGGRCVLAVIADKQYTFYMTDAAKYQEFKGADKSLPIKLTNEAYYAATSAKSPTVEYTDEDIDRLGEEYEDSGTLCKIGVFACAGSTAWFAVDMLIKKDFVSAPFSFITAILTCSGSYIQCKDYWRKYDAYKSAYNSKYGRDENGRPIIEADPTPASNPSTSTGGVTGTSPITPIPAGSTISTDMPSGGWGSPVSTVPILPEHNR